MSLAEECLICLQKKDWTRLNIVFSDNSNSLELLESPTFSVFENVLVDEIKRYETEDDEELFIVVARIFQIHEQKNSTFKISDVNIYKIAKYLFDKKPQSNYAKILVSDNEAQKFLSEERKIINSVIDLNKISGNLDIKIGESGNLIFHKMIFNSPQEKELFYSAKEVLPNHIILPNTALSSIIDSKICTILDNSTASFFYKSTLDLCIVNPQTFYPELFIELDSSWHDYPKNVQNDLKKDEIFNKAGLKLFRLRKKEQKNMLEIFQLFINKYYEI